MVIKCPLLVSSPKCGIKPVLIVFPVSLGKGCTELVVLEGSDGLSATLDIITFATVLKITAK